MLDEERKRLMEIKKYEDIKMEKLWQEICFTLTDISSSSSEDLYEQKIIQSLEKLGWSRFRKEIILKQRIQLGSARTIIPDIIVKALENNESFVIEVKKPSVDIENENHKKQLFSYMRQLRLTNGLLIGNKIQIYYDGQDDISKDPILLKSIEISELDKSGALFIELFHKNSFSYERLNHFSEKTLKEISAKDHKNKLRDLLLSPEYQDKILQVISNDLQQDWDGSTIDSVLAKLTVSISPKGTQSPSPIAVTPPVGSPTEMRIGKFVRANMTQIIGLCSCSKEELKNLESKLYSKQTFDINYPFLKKVDSEAPKQDKYWKDKYCINNNYYVATSEWFKGSFPFFQSYLDNKKIRGA